MLHNNRGPWLDSDSLGTGAMGNFYNHRFECPRCQREYKNFDWLKPQDRMSCDSCAAIISISELEAKKPREAA
jgi:ribosomal protein S27E